MAKKKKTIEKKNIEEIKEKAKPFHLANISNDEISKYADMGLVLIKSDKEKFDTISLDEITDKHIGKKGTKGRDEFDEKLYIGIKKSGGTIEYKIFDSIKQWHEIAGINVSTENTLEELIAQINIVDSEIDETTKAWFDFKYNYDRRDKGLSSNETVNKYKAELLDGLGDTIWTCVGMILRLGINPNDVMQRILDSNNSKFVPIGIANEKHINIIEQTVEKYKKQGIEVEHHVDNGYLVFRNKETKKILKPVTFVEPKLEELL
jgi:predicted HAD superfamily Cof-like phosphohydrolase